MEASYQAAVGALANRRGNQEEWLRLALERRALEDRQQAAAAQVGAELLPNAVDAPSTQF